MERSRPPLALIRFVRWHAQKQEVVPVSISAKSRGTSGRSGPQAGRISNRSRVSLIRLLLLVVLMLAPPPPHLGRACQLRNAYQVETEGDDQTRL
jgi:hypothetical protein